MKQKKCLGMMVLVFGLAIVGNLEAQTDSRLNGTWIRVVDGNEVTMVLRNGSLETFESGSPQARGTYTTSNGILTMSYSNFHGSRFSEIGLEPKWYTLNEFILAFRSALQANYFPEDSINEIISLLVSVPPAPYSVDMNSLIVTIEYNGIKNVEIYYKKIDAY